MQWWSNGFSLVKLFIVVKNGQLRTNQVLLNLGQVSDASRSDGHISVVHKGVHVVTGGKNDFKLLKVISRALSLDANLIKIDAKRSKCSVMNPTRKRVVPLRVYWVELADFFSGALVIGKHILEVLTVFPAIMPDLPLHVVWVVLDLMLLSSSSKLPFKRKGEAKV